MTRPIRRRRALFLAMALLACADLLPAAARRVVIIKADGVPGALLEQVREERDPETGKSRLPWIDEVFGRQGARLANFYVRGSSLSTPSWSIIDTGLHQRIHGNVEYDRFTLRAYDYLNFVPFFFGYALSRRVDMPGVEVLDEAGTPLLIDHFPPEERFQSFQLFQRGNRWSTLGGALPYHIRLRGPWRLLEDSQTGFEVTASIGERTERDLTASLHAPRERYFDFFTGDYDHTAHLNNNRDTQIRVLKSLDGLVGRLWTAIQATPQGPETILALVSDHGMNTMPGVFSQGFSLVDWFGSPEGGGHHVITNRYPLSEYKLHGLNPFVSAVTTASASSTYLKDDASRYPTAVLDLDGNERAAVELRSNDLNRLQMLLLLMVAEPAKSEQSRALANQFFSILDRRRPLWSRTVSELGEEMAALDREIGRQKKALKGMPKRFSPEDRFYGRDQIPRRLSAHVRGWEQEQKSYADYLGSIKKLLALNADGFDAMKVNIGEVIPRKSLGEANSIYDLQNYSVGPAPERTVNYLAALKNISVRNVLQKEVSSDPVDFIVVPVPPDTPGLPERGSLSEAVWLYGGEDRQALILRRADEIRYLPVKNLRGAEDGSIRFEDAGWVAVLPLHLWEDPQLDTAGRPRAEWLGEWHEERAWFKAVYRTEYSTGIIGVLEQFREPEPRRAIWDAGTPEADEVLLRRLEKRRRRLVIPDMLVFASDHWNFNTRGFNPGGNHGSFFQRSAHATFLIAGGSETGIPRGLVVTEPYDTLSFAPTILRLMGMPPRPGDPPMPGPVVEQLFAEPRLTERDR